MQVVGCVIIWCGPARRVDLAAGYFRPSSMPMPITRERPVSFSHAAC